MILPFILCRSIARVRPFRRSWMEQTPPGLSLGFPSEALGGKKASRRLPGMTRSRVT